ncbi:hypothetical protein FB639_001718 [Coemansia asiatica]|nr:hypothetical protein FB639_001718 [Coemansia asiatica]
MTLVDNESNDSQNSHIQDFSSSSKKPDMPLWKLAFQWQVLSASIVTLSTGMLIGSLEGVLPLYTKDRFNASASKIGLLFVLNGSVAILLSPLAGWIIDKLINRYKEIMRMYIEIVGLALAGCSVLVLGFSTSFGMTLAIESWLSFAILLVNIPVMSSFGDFVNGLGLNSMAQCYGIYNVFWALSSSVAPPIATFLYTRIGYRATVSGILSSLCAICIIVILGDSIARLFRRRENTHEQVQETQIGSVQGF